MSRLTKNCNY